MAVFQKISGFKRVSFCRRCSKRMFNAKPSEIYCESCVKHFRDCAKAHA